VDKELSKNSLRVSYFNRKNPGDLVYWELFKAWWNIKRGISPSELMVTDHGFCAFVDEKPVCISYLYLVLGSESAMQGYQVCSPKSTMAERGLAIPAMTTQMAEFSKKVGYKVLVAYPGNKAILKRLLDAGFVVNDKKVTQVIKEL
jgi:hypothetical protein